MNRKLIGTECVRIDGVWRVVEVYVDVLALACSLAPRAARTKSQASSVRFGSVRVKVRPQ
jgi:hypothetical protein